LHTAVTLKLGLTLCALNSVGGREWTCRRHSNSWCYKQENGVIYFHLPSTVAVSFKGPLMSVIRAATKPLGIPGKPGALWMFERLNYSRLM